MHAECWWQSLLESANMEGQEENGRIILKLILGKQMSGLELNLSIQNNVASALGYSKILGSFSSRKSRERYC
jgi:hypothetical protein